MIASTTINYLEAEEFVADGLAVQGWMILARNFRRRSCEIDIVACKQTTLIFVEVKYRGSGVQTEANCSALLGRTKQRALRQGATRFLQQHHEINFSNLRFDLAIVGKNKLGKFKLDHYFVNVIHDTEES